MRSGQFIPILHYLRRLTGGRRQETTTDGELLQRFVALREGAAFEALVERHGPLVWGVCRRMLPDPNDAEDSFQATFLVMVRKAGTVVKQESVRSWLYGVAFRIARRARSAAARRRADNSSLTHEPAAPTADEAAWRQLQPLLDEELNRLPERYRAPLVLCYLEGKTRDEAALELGWSAGAVKGRLERGRDRLRERLLRRGLTLSTSLAPALLTENAKALPLPLIQTTIGQATAGVSPSPSVLELAKGAMQAMFWNKVKVLTAALFLVASVSLGIGLMAHRENAVAALTPLPEPANEPRPDNKTEAAWGEPKNGVRVGLAPQQVGIRPDVRDLKLQVWYENVDKVDREVPNHASANCYQLMFRGTKDGKAFIVSYHVPRKRTVPPVMVKLKPGERFHEEFTLTFRQKPGEPWFGLPDLGLGKSITLQAGWCPQSDPSLEEHWTAADTVMSGPITVQCRTDAGAKGSEPAVKDGLAIVVTPAKAVFTEKEPVQFAVKFTNVSDKTFMLFDAPYYWGWTIKFGDWVLVHLAEDKRNYLPSMPLEAGRSLTVNVTLDSTKDQAFRFEWKGVGGKPEAPRRSLPVGKFALSVTITLKEDIRKERLRDYQFPHWTGQIVTNPVTFDIVDGKSKGSAEAK